MHKIFWLKHCTEGTIVTQSYVLLISRKTSRDHSSFYDYSREYETNFMLSKHVKLPLCLNTSQVKKT